MVAKTSAMIQQDLAPMLGNPSPQDQVRSGRPPGKSTGRRYSPGRSAPS